MIAEEHVYKEVMITAAYTVIDKERNTTYGVIDEGYLQKTEVFPNDFLIKW